MEKWGVTLGKTILPKNFGRKPKPVKRLVPKVCLKCGITYIPRYNGNGKYCIDCKVLVLTERSNKNSRKKRGNCIKCQTKEGSKILTENEEGQEEIWCRGCYEKALQEN